MDYATDILDEIALEGLDGITVDGLWLRLSQRPCFLYASQVKDDTKTQTYVWMIVKRLRDVEFFRLAKPRKPLTITDSYTVDSALGIITESRKIGEDLYPHKLVNTDGILGSCSTYDERKNVSKKVRKLSLTEVQELFGDRLVIVASQTVRHQALIGVNTNPSLEISPIQYCILERIGRSRYHGQSTQGKLGLTALGEDPKTIFYLRKHLLKYNLIKKQYFQQKSDFAGLLLHLPRFFSLVKPKYIELLEYIVKAVKEGPNDYVDYDVLRKNIPNVGKLAKILYFKKYFRTDVKAYREVYPEATEKQWKTKSSEKEKVVRVVSLRDPNLEPGDVQKRFSGNCEDDDDEETGILNDDNHLLDAPFMTQCQIMFKKYKGDGLTQVEVAKMMGLQKVQARTTLKNCQKVGVLGTFMQDNGRQRCTKFFLKNGGQLDEDHKLLVENTAAKEQFMLSDSLVQSNNLKRDSGCSETDCSGDNGKRKLISDTENECKRIKLTNGESDTSVGASEEQVKESSVVVDTDVINMEVDGDKVEDLREDRFNFPDKNIKVKISDDYNWLMPQIHVNKLAKLKEKSLNTSRLLKRSNVIVEAVHDLKVTDTRRLALMINRSEYQEGVTFTMDKKSLYRILFKLAYSNYIKVYRVTMENTHNTFEFNFVCDSNISPDDQRIKSAIHFNKLKFLSMNNSKPSVPKASPKKHVITYQKRPATSHIPKFIRMSILHKFLYYLVYDYSGTEGLDQDVVRARLSKQCEEEIDSLPTVYLPTADERMFVPPLPRYSVTGQCGWCLLSDVIVRLPLSMFMNLIQIQYSIPELDEYMNHPIKKYYLISNLPTNIRKCMTATRKYVFTVFDDIVKLAYIGLIQFGAQQNKDKDQVFVFLNRNAILMDTMTSKPSYNKISPDIDYPWYRYKFNKLQDVQDYWHYCWKTCMNTNLGRKSLATTDVVIENVLEKQDMINSLKPREFSEAVHYDTGYVPGDKMGAAGFDSALFSHLKRNWFCKSIFTPGYGNGKLLYVTRKHLSLLHQKNIALRQRSKLQEYCVNKIAKFNKNSKEGGGTKGLKRMHKGRIRKAKVSVRRSNAVTKALRRKPYYDQVDKEALKHMSKLRVDWSAEEDRMLLICRVASTFLCADMRKHVNANIFQTYREVLHGLYPQAKNKTSRACQRRVAYMLRSANTLHNVQLCVEELKMDESIMSKYSNVVELVHSEARKTNKRLSDMGSIWRQHFISLVNELMARYDHNGFHNFSLDVVQEDKQQKPVNNVPTIPDTLEGLYENFHVQFVEKRNMKRKDLYKSITNRNDIYAAIIHTTIHSTLSSSDDKTSWSYHLFSIYQQYPEKALRSVLNRLRANQMVSYRKSYQVKSDKTFLPLSASPYQLSISYVNLMQTKYQGNTFEDCYKTFCDMMEFKAKLSGSDVDKGMELLSVVGGQTAAVVELFNNNMVEFSISIPSQVIMLDPNIKNKNETYSRLVQRYEDMLKVNNKDLTCSILFQKDNYTSDCVEEIKGREVDEESGEEGVNTEKDVVTEDKGNHATHNVAKASSRIALFMINEKYDENNELGLIPKEVDHVYDFFLVNSCKVFGTLLDNTGDHTDIVTDDVVSSVANDLCRVAIFQSSGGVEVNEESGDKVADVDVEAPQIVDLSGDVLEKIIGENFNCEDVDLVKNILAKMKERNEFGLTNEELISEFGNSIKIVNILDKLVDLWLVLKSGVFYCRYIYYAFTRPWLLWSFRNCEEYDEEEKESANKVTEITDNDFVEDNIDEMEVDKEEEDFDNIKNHKMTEPIKVIIKPWIKVNGEINRRLLDAFLSSILSHVMLYPGISLSKVQERFAPAYLPQNIREACDILIKLKCIKRYCVTVRGKPSLLSKPCEILMEEATGLESGESIRYEATIFAITNLGKFLSSKPHVTDFYKSLQAR